MQCMLKVGSLACTSLTTRSRNNQNTHDFSSVFGVHTAPLLVCFAAAAELLAAEPSGAAGCCSSAADASSRRPGSAAGKRAAPRVPCAGLPG